MNKNIILGIAAFGGLMIIGFMLANKGNEEVTVEGVITEMDSEIVTLPAGIPASVPIYPSASIVSASDSKGDTDIDYSLSMHSEDTVKEINEWYAEALSKNGWSIKSDKNIGPYRVIQGESGNLYTNMQAANGSEAGVVRISQSIKIRGEVEAK